MAVAFRPGDTIGRGDLDIFLTNAASNPTNAAEITYALYYLDPGPPEAEVLIGSVGRIPVNPAVGEYYASLMVPPTSAVGTYRIRWSFRELLTSPLQQVVQEFAVVADGSSVAPSPYSQCEQELIYKLRVFLRDQNPDKFYHFRPPEHEGQVGQYNRIFGQIWEDEELKLYLEWAIDEWDTAPPSTRVRTINNLCSGYQEWRGAIMWEAIAHACFAVAMNWIADEFDYSIGGVSLTLEKYSKYESMKQNAEGQFDKGVEQKARTVKYIRGLQQPRFGIGIRSAFGPHVGRGVLSPRNFL